MIRNNPGKEISLLGFALFENRSLKFELIYAKKVSEVGRRTNLISCGRLRVVTV